MKKSVKIIALALAFCMLAVSLCACGGKGETMMTFADKRLTVNTYEFMLSRMKGTLATYGYEVASESFWKTVISPDGTTYDDYFRTSVLEQASRYIIAEYLFDRYGLVLTEEREKLVDDLMALCVKRAGSKTALNSELKSFGANYDILRDLYLLETKIDMVKDHLYGEDGELISDEVKQEYLEEKYVAFGQIYLASYYYLIDTDRFGDHVYYTDDKHKHIAYDKENGSTQTDEYGKTIKDIFGEDEYFTEDGKIAYDKKNGKLGYVVDDKGEYVVEYYDDEKLGELYDNAHTYADACDGDIDAFVEMAEIYDEMSGKGETLYLYSEEHYYGLQSESYEYLDDITKALGDMEVEECKVIESDYGYHVICKYEMPEKAYEDEDQKDVFEGFMEDLVGELFDTECAKFESQIKLVTEVYDTASKMSEIGTNTLY